jgi:hypothetical protein
MREIQREQKEGNKKEIRETEELKIKILPSQFQMVITFNRKL